MANKKSKKSASQEEESRFSAISKKTGRPVSAYEIVMEGLDTAIRVKGRGRSHVTGEELCRGLVLFAACEYGYLGPVVMQLNGLRHCEDVGDAVFEMIDSGDLQRTCNDRREDFDGLFDLCGEIKNRALENIQRIGLS